MRPRKFLTNSLFVILFFTWGLLRSTLRRISEWHRINTLSGKEEHKLSDNEYVEGRYLMIWQWQQSKLQEGDTQTAEKTTCKGGRQTVTLKVTGNIQKGWGGDREMRKAASRSCLSYLSCLLALTYLKFCWPPVPLSSHVTPATYPPSPSCHPSCYSSPMSLHRQVRSDGRLRAISTVNQKKHE